jgi:signal transduction histidine kinase/HPt (histidine-containing phosphotransfer) domain-containing protein/FixJ family two-component response regulator
MIFSMPTADCFGGARRPRRLGRGIVKGSTRQGGKGDRMKAGVMLKANMYQILLVFISFLVMVFVSYFHVSGIVRQQIQSLGDVSMEATRMSITASLEETELLFANIVLTVEGMLAEHKSNNDILLYLRKTNAYYSAARTPIPDFMKVYGYIRGEWLDGSGWVPPFDYVPESRPWHIGAENSNGRIYFSEPYIDAETGGMCVTFSQKALDRHGESHGILAVDLKLDRISALVRNRKVSGNGYGVLIDDKKTFLVHRDQGMVGLKMDSAGGDYPRLAKMLESGGQISAVRFRDADNTDSIIFFRTVFNGWHIGIVIPRISYYREVHSLATVLGFLGLLLAIVLSSLLVRMWEQKTRADEESSSKSSFLARMSHEIRTPMNAIIGLSEMARREYGSPKGLEYIADVKIAGINLLAVINDILDFSKIESGRLEIVAVPYDTASLLCDVLTVISVRLKETPLELILDISPELPAAMTGDAGRVRQVLLNLLSNAVKYTKNGFIRFSASGEALSGDGGVRLTFLVEDSGIGIKQDDMPKLFERFSRIDEKLHINIEGSGLGLVISRNLCRAMGGDITVRSEYGKGSVFTATLVQAVADPEPMGDINIASVSRAEEQRVTFTAPEAEVLIVDDLSSNLLVAEGLLAPYKARVFTCLNGREAVELARKRPFDLILMDHMMPEMDGVEATRAIRGMAEDHCRTMPVVALTANAVSGMREMFLENGFSDFLAKPVETAKLDAVLKRWLPPEKLLAADDAAHNGGTAAPDLQAVIVKGLDVEKGIKNVGGSKSSYADVLAAFRQDCENQIHQLRAALAGGDLLAYATAAHALKGALRTIGAGQLAFAAMRLESAAGKGDVGVLKEATESFLEGLRALAGSLDLVTPGLNAQDDDRNDEAPGKIDVSPLKLDVLKKALSSMDARAVNDLLAECRNMELTPEQRKLVNEMDMLVMAFEFDAAVKKIDDLSA